jgi:hypothetical protein
MLDATENIRRVMPSETISVKNAGPIVMPTAREKYFGDWVP